MRPGRNDVCRGSPCQTIRPSSPPSGAFILSAMWIQGASAPPPAGLMHSKVAAVGLRTRTVISQRYPWHRLQRANVISDCCQVSRDLSRTESHRDTIPAGVAGWPSQFPASRVRTHNRRTRVGRSPGLHLPLLASGPSVAGGCGSAEA